MKYQSLQFITDYVRATDNEIAIDESVYEVCELRPAELGFAPRPAKLVGRFSSCKFVIKYLLVVVARFGCLVALRYFFYLSFFVTFSTQ